MLLFFIIKEWKKDCKEIGKENLAVPLSERLSVYFAFVVFPIIIGIIVSLQ